MGKHKQRVQPRVYRGADAGMVGAHEPTWPDRSEQKLWSATHRRTLIADAFRWYNLTQDGKIHNEWVAQWLETSPKRKMLGQIVRKHGGTTKSSGYLCRASMLGLHLSITELRKIHEMLGEIVEAASLAQEAKADMPAVRVVTIADRVTEKVKQCRGEIEYQFDQFVQNSCSGDPSVIGTLIQFNVPQNRVRELAQSFQSRVDEFQQVLAGTDPYMIEAYSNFTRRQVRSVIRWLTTMQEQILSYGTMKAANRKPKTRKPKSPERQVARLKYQKKLEAPAIESIEPTQVLRSSELWVYDVKRRKLGLYVVDDTQTAFSVKGTTLLGYSETQSVCKILRKPEKQLLELLKLGKPASRKWFEAIKATEVVMSGRLNSNMLLLKAYK